MKTTVNQIIVHVPADENKGLDEHDYAVRIATRGGDLMMNRLLHYLQLEYDTRHLLFLNKAEEEEGEEAAGEGEATEEKEASEEEEGEEATDGEEKENETPEELIDCRILVRVPNSNDLLRQMTAAYLKKSKAMRRMDNALDRKTEENKDWHDFAQWLYNSLCDLAESSEAFIHAVLDARDGGDGLLAQVTQPLEDLQSKIGAANEIILEVEEESDSEYGGCDHSADTWGLDSEENPY